MKIHRKLNAYDREACAKRVGKYDEARISALVLAGKTNTAIAAETGFSRVTIAKARARLRLDAAKNGRPANTQGCGATGC